MRQTLGQLGVDKCGIDPNKMLMIQNGDVLIAEAGKVEIAKEKVETKYILIDGKGEGKLGSSVISDREIMKQNGAVIVLIHIIKKGGKLKKRPDVVSRGFIYMHESEEITEEISKIAGDAYTCIHEKDPKASRQDIKKYIRQTVDKFTHQKLERRPLVIPLIIED